MKQVLLAFFAVLIFLIWEAVSDAAAHLMFGAAAAPRRALSATRAELQTDVVTNTAYLPLILHPFYYHLPLVSLPPFIDMPYPEDDSEGESLNAFLAWKVHPGIFQQPTFMVYLEADNPNPSIVVAENLVSPNLDPETFSENTQYYWKVTAVDATGKRVESETWTFKTEARTDPPDLDAMSSVPAGGFFMGCDSSNPFEYTCSYNVWHLDEPVRFVQIDAFEIDKYEVTNSEYRVCMEAGVCAPPVVRTVVDDRAYDQYPVTFVSWWDATAFCTWEGKRLPTEAEWEKAARGAIDTRIYPWGNETPDCHRVSSSFYREGEDCNQVEDGPGPVGRHPRGASPYGAYDMSGNIFEWVNDKYDVNYYNYAPNENPPGPPFARTYRTSGDPMQPATSDERGYPVFTIRGGSWAGHTHYMRVSHRHFGHHGPQLGVYADAPYFRNHRVGFRCAR